MVKFKVSQSNFVTNHWIWFWDAKLLFSVDDESDYDSAKTECPIFWPQNINLGRYYLNGWTKEKLKNQNQPSSSYDTWTTKTHPKFRLLKWRSVHRKNCDVIDTADTATLDYLPKLGWLIKILLFYVAFALKLTENCLHLLILTVFVLSVQDLL